MDSGRFGNMVNSPTTAATTTSGSSTPTKNNKISQSLASILNNPHAAKYEPEFAPLPVTPKPGSDISRSDFAAYLSSISEPYSRFHHIQQHEKFSSIEGQDGVSTAGQGEALVACLREVPAFYFEEEFKLEEGAMSFRASENLVLQERLSQYLDVVELHLVKEIALRSSSFFEAQGQLEELNSMIVQGCSRIRELKETIRLLESGLVGSAKKVQGLSKRRNDLIALQNKLHLILYVNQALSALKLLVASADCAGALDVIDDLQHLLEGDELTGLHCFRHLRDHVAASTESINSILSAEFLRASIRDAGGIDASLLSKFKESATVASSRKDDEVKLDEDEIGSFRDRLLPLVIGLLRTAKLPGALRVYRETLTGDMKIAIKTTVEELLPILIAQPLESDFIPGERMVEADGGGSSLATRLRSLPAESFVHLLRAVFAIVRAHLLRASEVKKAIEWILSNPDGHYAADSVAAALTLGAAAAESAQETGQFSSILPSPSQRNAGRVHSVQGRGNDATSPSNLSRNFRADVLRENAEAVFAGCDAAHGRWAKLLGVRSVIHPKLRLPEFLSIFNITQEFISTTEKIGGRLGYSIRGTLQSQAKAFVDFQHDSRMTKMKALLDQENWAEVDVPDEYQAIVASLIPLESSDSGNIVEANNIAEYNEGSLSSGSAQPAENGLSNSPQPIEQNNHPVSHADGGNHGNSSHSVRSSESNNAEPETSSAQHVDVNTRERTKTSIRTLSFRGDEYHMVNCGLNLLKVLSDYVDMNNCLPTLSSEIVHRIVEILKFFNTRTAQLVLGAGAMQVSGLRSITSKNLALASQVISFIYAIIPDIRRILFVKVPDTRRGMLSSEIDRVAQDYKVHRDEIHSKLVQIMRERLVFHLRGLPQMVESWNRPDDTDIQPSQFARALTKEVNFLQRVLSRTLHEVDVQAIFRQVAVIFHSQISEALSPLDINTPQAKKRLYRDIQHILGCIRSLPSDNPSKSNPPNWGQLDEFLLHRFGAEAGQ